MLQLEGILNSTRYKFHIINNCFTAHKYLNICNRKSNSTKASSRVIWENLSFSLFVNLSVKLLRGFYWKKANATRLFTQNLIFYFLMHFYVWKPFKTADSDPLLILSYKINRSLQTLLKKCFVSLIKNRQLRGN